MEDAIYADEFADDTWLDEPSCAFELRVSHAELADYMSRTIGTARMTPEDLGALIVARIKREAAGEELYERTVALERAGLAEEELRRVVRFVEQNAPRFIKVGCKQT